MRTNSSINTNTKHARICREHITNFTFGTAQYDLKPRDMWYDLLLNSGIMKNLDWTQDFVL